MGRAARIAAWGFGAAVLLVVVLGGAIWVAGNTDPGRTLIERLTYRLSSGHVKLTKLGGAFPMRLTLGELQLNDAGGAWLTADNLSVWWSPFALLQRRIQIDSLRVGRLDVERAPVSQPGGGEPWIPHVEVGEFAVGTVRLGASLAGRPASLSLRGNLRLRSLADAKAELMARRIDGDGEYVLHLRLDPQRVDAALTLHEPAGGPLENLLALPGLGVLSATLKIEGPRNAGRVDVVLDAGELQARMQGSMNLTHGAADLTYSLKAPAMAPRPDIAWERIALQGSWHGSLTTPSADGRLDIARLRIAGGTEISRLTAGLAANAGKLLVNAVAEGLVIPGPQPRFLANDPVRIDATLQLNAPNRPLDLTATHPRLSLQAHADTAGRQRAAVEMNLPDLAPFAALAGQDVRGRAKINAELARADGGMTLALTGNAGLTGGTAPWISLLGPRVAVQLSGSLANDTVKIDTLRVDSHAATLAAGAAATRIAGTSDFSVNSIKDIQARWQLDVADLAALSKDVAGNLKMSGRLSGAPTALVSDTELTSRLSVRGSASGMVGASVHLRGLPKSPGGSIQAHGMLDGAPLAIDAGIERGGGNALRLTVHQADWKSAHVDGDLTADAALTQSRGQLHLRIGQLGDLDRLLGMHIGGSIDGGVGFVPAQGRLQAQLHVDGKDLSVGSVGGSVHVQAAGEWNSLNLQLRAQSPDLYGSAADFSSAATLDLDGRQLRITAASLAYRGATLRLLSPAALSFANGAAVDDLRLGAQSAILEIKGQFAPAVDLNASLRQVKPGLVNVFAPQLLAEGLIEAQARLQGGWSNLSGVVRLDGHGLRFADDAATGLPAVDLHAQAQLAANVATMNAGLTAGPGSQITASGTAPLSADGALDLKLAGKLDIGLANPLLEARGMHAAGRLTVDATVTGSAAAPQAGGGITLADGSLRDYGRGVNLSDINSQVVGSEGALQIKSFTAKAASGSIAMTGSFGVLKHGLPVDLTITAKNAQPIASSVVTANLDADLHVSGTARERLDVAGTVHVNRANIGIPDSLPPDVAVLDVRRRGGGAPADTGKQLVIGIDVSIQAPQEILVQGRGLDAELGGSIKLRGTSDAPQVSGGFDLQRGSFSLAGTKLNFTQGRVSFDGAGLRNKIDPTLDFTAQTTVTDTTATLRITGLADAPRFDFSSSPTLPPDEIMARLLFGQNAAQLSALQVAEIGAALATLSGVGGGGSNPLVKLQKTLGLDRLTVGTNTTSTATGTENSGAAIAAGRYVSKRVYVEGKQTTTGTSQVQVDVDLTKHLKLQTRLGNGTASVQGTTPENDPGSSIGLSYQFEY